MRRGAVRRLFCAQFTADGFFGGGKIALALEIAPAKEIPGRAAPHRGVAVGGKVQPQRVEQRGHTAFKAVPVLRHHAAALFVFDHQRLGGVLARQVLFGKARLRNDRNAGVQRQRPQRAGRVGRGAAVLPVLPVQQCDRFAAGKPQRAGKSVDEHLVAQPAPNSA